jgi:hypothetical protein
MNDEHAVSEGDGAPEGQETAGGSTLGRLAIWLLIAFVLLCVGIGIWRATRDRPVVIIADPSGHPQTLEERNAQLERELEAAKRAPPVCDDALTKKMIAEGEAPAARVSAQQVVDNTIYLTLAGQRQTKLPLSAVEWSQPVSIPSTALGVAPVNVNFEIMPAVGFKARVLDDLTPPGMPYREVSVPRDGSLPVAGLRRIEFKAMTAGQQAVVRISD